MEIRNATREDLAEILQIYENARQFMAAHGNPTQWGTGYPKQEMLEADITRGELYVVVNGAAVEGIFVFTTRPEPTYTKIYGGAWKNDAPYGTIHRAASAGHQRGIGQMMLNWCFAQCGNMRGDTHQDNLPMQHQFEYNGYAYCGRIYVEDGTERLAYQRMH